MSPVFYINGGQKKSPFGYHHGKNKTAFITLARGELQRSWEDSPCPRNEQDKDKKCRELMPWMLDNYTEGQIK